MDDAPTTAHLAAVGPRLRGLRTTRNITLTDLAERTGISVSTLSRLESGSRRPTLELLLPLARAYDVTLDDLVDAPDTGDPRVTLRPVTHHGMTVIPLTKRPGGIQAWKIVLAPDSPNTSVRPRSRRSTKATSGCMCSTAGYGSCSVTRTSCSPRVKQRSSTPGSRTGSVPPVTSPSRF